jgi:DNA-binding transcriptional ArsR family regulator
VLDTLITSKTRIKLLLKFFLNSKSESYLRNLEEEFGESTNAIRVELNKLEKAGLLDSRSQGNKKLFRANTTHPLFPEIHNLLLKHIGFDRIIDKVVMNLGEVQRVFLVGELAKGINTGIIDLIFVGGNINKTYLVELVEKTEKLIKRNIRYLVFSAEEIEAYIEEHADTEILLLWTKE